MTILYDASAKGIIMTYVNLVNVRSPVIVTAAGVDEWMSIDNAEEADLEAGCDGSEQAHVKATVIKGKITLLPLSPALVNAFIATQQEQYLLGVPIPGTLTTISPSGQWSNTYQNFIITSVYKGYEFGHKVKDVSVDFKSSMPQSTILGDLLSLGLAATGIAGL
jgi:hypothetical protein